MCRCRAAARVPLCAGMAPWTLTAPASKPQRRAYPRHCDAAVGKILPVRGAGHGEASGARHRDSGQSSGGEVSVLLESAPEPCHVLDRRDRSLLGPARSSALSCRRSAVRRFFHRDLAGTSRTAQGSGHDTSGADVVHGRRPVGSRRYCSRAGREQLVAEAAELTHHARMAGPAPVRQPLRRGEKSMVDRPACQEKPRGRGLGVGPTVSTSGGVGLPRRASRPWTKVAGPARGRSGSLRTASACGQRPG